MYFIIYSKNCGIPSIDRKQKKSIVLYNVSKHFDQWTQLNTGYNKLQNISSKLISYKYLKNSVYFYILIFQYFTDSSCIV